MVGLWFWLGREGGLHHMPGMFTGAEFPLQGDAGNLGA